MHISLNWIRRHCPFETLDEPIRIGERFSLATAEVEGVEVRGEGLDQFVAARVEAVEKIEGTKLTMCRVNDGGAEPRTVVCGAPNVEPGMVAPLARPGSVVRGTTIRDAKIRGVPSSGMLMAEDEVGISDSHEGLMVLPPETAPGTPLAELFPDLRDIVLEVDNKSLTHRPDLWGHYGIAREFATIYDSELAPYELDESLAAARGGAEVVVSIADGEARRRCRRYCGLRIDGVRVGPSPAWLKHLLLSVGSRPINNIVDITNFVLFDLGQPLHAFDREVLRGGQVIVRMPDADEKLTLLDGREIDLDPGDLVIADGEGPVALAGVMGGENSGITEETVSIFLESANFDPVSVRRSSIRHGRTDSSARFEKSLDPHQARLGILRAAALVLELCPGAKVVGPMQDVGFEPPEPTVIDLPSDLIPKRLGKDLAADELRKILGKLGFVIDEGERAAADIGLSTGSQWRVTVPSWRATRDVSIREDLVEEVGRLHGYGEIDPRAPEWPVVAPAGNPQRTLERRIKEFLALRGGLDEIFTYSAVGKQHCKLFDLDADAHLALRNFMSVEMDRLRREIVPVHLEKARENLRFLDDFGFFELGRVYRKDPAKLRDPELPDEHTRIAGIVVAPKKSDAVFYRVRRTILELLDHLEIASPRLEALDASVTDLPWVHPNVGARVTAAGGLALGAFYRVHPEFVNRLELGGEVCAFDLDFRAVAGAPREPTRYTPLPRFPSVPFDVAVVAPERTTVGEIIETIRESAGELLRDSEVFDVYRGKGVGEGKKSVAIQLEFRADDHTLDADEIDELQGRVIASLEKAGFPLRS